MTQDTPHAVADLFLALYPRFKRLISAPLQQTSEDGTTLSQVRTLGRLIGQPITLSELAERCEMTRQGASLQVQSLVEHGWVRRIPDATDRRSALLEVTDEGLAHWRNVRSLLIENLADAFTQLTLEELSAFQRVNIALQRILDQRDAEKEANHGE